MEKTIHTEVLPSGFSFNMRLIPGGTFNMGSPDDDDQDARNNEKPQRMGLQVAPFYLAPFQVTQALWKAVMGETNNPSRFLGDQRPVEQITWHDTQAFITALNAATKANRQNQGLGAYRLPTEAEWEYAARGGPIDAGYQYAGSDKLKEVGWYKVNSDNETHEVGLLMPNSLSLYDMSGNVDEWVEDHWHKNYKNAPKDGRAWLTDDTSDDRVLRGGSCFYVSRDCRVACRTLYAPGSRHVFIGFRLALSPSLGQSLPAIP